MPPTLAVMPAVMLAVMLVVTPSNQIQLYCHWFDQYNKPHRI